MKNTIKVLVLGMLLVFGLTQANAQHCQLISFTTKSTDGGIYLDWSIAKEQNFPVFTLERSQDGLHFTAIQQINGASNNQPVLAYHAVDKEPLSGIVYYRLRQAHMKGEAAFSKIAITDTSYPNVLANKESMSAGVQESDSHIHFSLSDKHGQVILEKELVVSGSPVEVEIPQLPAGLYLVKEEGGNQAQIQNATVELRITKVENK